MDACRQITIVMLATALATVTNCSMAADITPTLRLSVGMSAISYRANNRFAGSELGPGSLMLSVGVPHIVEIAPSAGAVPVRLGTRADGPGSATLLTFDYNDDFEPVAISTIGIHPQIHDGTGGVTSLKMAYDVCAETAQQFRKAGWNEHSEPPRFSDSVSLPASLESLVRTASLNHKQTDLRFFRHALAQFR